VDSITFTPETAGTIVVMAYGLFTNNSGSTNGASITINLGDDFIGGFITVQDGTSAATSPVYTRNVGPGYPITINLYANEVEFLGTGLSYDATWTVMFFN
jgi:hypothetical protein